MSAFKFINSVAKCYNIFDWNGNVSLEVFYKYIYFTNILRGVSLKLLKEPLKNTGRWPKNSTARCSVKLLRYILQKYQKVFWKYAGRSLAKLLKNFLQKYRNIFRKNTYTWSTWEVFCKNTESCFAKVLKGVCQNWWGEFYIHTKNEQPPFKNSVTWVVSC